MTLESSKMYPFAQLKLYYETDQKPKPYMRCVLVNSSPLNALSSPVPRLFTAAAVSDPESVFLSCSVSTVSSEIKRGPEDARLDEMGYLLLQLAGATGGARGDERATYHAPWI